MQIGACDNCYGFLGAFFIFLCIFAVICLDVHAYVWGMQEFYKVMRAFYQSNGHFQTGCGHFSKSTTYPIWKIDLNVFYNIKTLAKSNQGEWVFGRQVWSFGGKVYLRRDFSTLSVTCPNLQNNFMFLRNIMLYFMLKFVINDQVGQG